MKIYVITSGSYSDYRIERVFTDKAKAKAYCKHESSLYLHEKCEIEEFDSSDDWIPPKLNKSYLRDAVLHVDPERKVYRFEAPSKTRTVNDEAGSDHWAKHFAGADPDKGPYDLGRFITEFGATTETIHGWGRTRDAATKSLNDRMARAIQIVEALGFKPGIEGPPSWTATTSTFTGGFIQL